MRCLEFLLFPSLTKVKVPTHLDSRCHLVANQPHLVIMSSGTFYWRDC